MWRERKRWPRAPTVTTPHFPHHHHHRRRQRRRRRAIPLHHPWTWIRWRATTRTRVEYHMRRPTHDSIIVCNTRRALIIDNGWNGRDYGTAPVYQTRSLIMTVGTVTRRRRCALGCIWIRRSKQQYTLLRIKTINWSIFSGVDLTWFRGKMEHAVMHPRRWRTSSVDPFAPMHRGN